KEVRFYVFNIRLLTSENRNADSYEELFIKLFNDKITVNTYSMDHVILRTQYRSEIGGHKNLAGQISRFTRIEGDDWLDFENRKIVNYEIPSNLFPNLKETNYIFIPEAHRFCLVVENGTVSNSAAEKF